MTAATASPRILEEKTLNAWPALQQVVYDGWLLRFARGYTKRANSVVPMFAGQLGVDAKIARCEAAYADRRQAAVFKMLPWSEPGDLDGRLAASGYGRVDTTSVQVRPLAADKAGLPADRDLRLRPTADWDWLQAFGRLTGLPPKARPLIETIVNNIVPSACFGLLLDQGRTVCCGLAVCEDGYLGLYGIATEPQARRRGYAGRLLGQLTAWGRRQGAHTAYLQVVAANLPALRLYEKLGFAEKYRYWYRVKPRP